MDPRLPAMAAKDQETECDEQSRAQLYIRSLFFSLLRSLWEKSEFYYHIALSPASSGRARISHSFPLPRPVALVALRSSMFRALIENHIGWRRE